MTRALVWLNVSLKVTTLFLLLLQLHTNRLLHCLQLRVMEYYLPWPKYRHPLTQPKVDLQLILTIYHLSKQLFFGTWLGRRRLVMQKKLRFKVMFCLPHRKPRLTLQDELTTPGEIPTMTLCFCVPLQEMCPSCQQYAKLNKWLNLILGFHEHGML